MWNSWSNEETSRLDIVSLWLVTACEFPMQSLWPLNKPLRYLFDFSSCLFVLVFAGMPACPLAINSPCLHGSTSFHHHSSHGSHFRSLQGLNLFIWVVWGFFFSIPVTFTQKNNYREKSKVCFQTYRVQVWRCSETDRWQPEGKALWVSQLAEVPSSPWLPPPLLHLLMGPQTWLWPQDCPQSSHTPALIPLLSVPFLFLSLPLSGLCFKT